MPELTDNQIADLRVLQNRCPLLTPPARSEWIAPSSVTIPRHAAGLPKQIRPPSARNRRIYHRCSGRTRTSRSLARSCSTVGLIIRFLFIGSRL
jgi:hypothetical protein